MKRCAVRGEFSYIVLRGLSMWPGLIPGDVVRAAKVNAAELLPGDIVAMEIDEGNLIIHRLVEVQVSDDGSVILQTSGDRSGPDRNRILRPGEELLKVTGVLRSGVWKHPGRKPVSIARGIPTFMVRVHCLAVRKLCW